jgi:hypothetical protein
LKIPTLADELPKSITIFTTQISDLKIWIPAKYIKLLA